MHSEFIQKVKNLKIGIIGETIIDEYNWVRLAGSSPKSRCPSGTIIDCEQYKGGAAYIKRIIEKFVDNVVFITGSPITKTRYVEQTFQVKYLELCSGQNDSINIDAIDKKFKNCDFIIVADFGHNLIDRVLAEHLSDTYGDRMSLMCQTNSLNYGYNNLCPKYKAAAYVCLDQRELGLILQKKELDAEDLYNLWNYLKFDTGTLTMGEKGAFTVGGTTEHKADCFKNGIIIDTIGAGDTFFTLASLAYAIRCSVKDLTFLGSLGGYYNTTFPATKKAFSPEALEKLSIKYGVQEYETVY